jgi:hypothetical protein
MLSAIILLPIASQAQEPAEPPAHIDRTMPRCGPQMDGQVFCQFGTVYECEFVSPNSMERRTGWRWKPDILRDCTEQPPATIDQHDDLPPETTNGLDQTDRGRSADPGCSSSSNGSSAETQGRTMYIRPEGCLRGSTSNHRN